MHEEEKQNGKIDQQMCNRLQQELVTAIMQRGQEKELPSKLKVKEKKEKKRV